MRNQEPIEWDKLPVLKKEIPGIGFELYSKLTISLSSMIHKIDEPHLHLIEEEIRRSMHWKIYGPIIELINEIEHSILRSITDMTQFDVVRGHFMRLRELIQYPRKDRK